jgi:hypothetical protein
LGGAVPGGVEVQTRDVRERNAARPIQTTKQRHLSPTQRAFAVEEEFELCRVGGGLGCLGGYAHPDQYEQVLNRFKI